MWIAFGIASVIFTVLHISASFSNPKKADWIAFCALSFLALTVLSEYSMVNHWVANKDWAALTDVVPSMNGLLTGYVIVIILINFIAVAGRHSINRN